MVNNPVQMQALLTIRQFDGHPSVCVGGSIDRRSARMFAQVLSQDTRALTRGNARIELDLSDLELDDGSAVAEAVNAIRELLADSPVVLRQAPQMLAHTLYKAGLLRDGQLSLVEPRTEHGAAS